MAEVFLGLLQRDKMSYLSHHPPWNPALSSTGDIKMTELLRLASVVGPLYL